MSILHQYGITFAPRPSYVHTPLPARDRAARIRTLCDEADLILATRLTADGRLFRGDLRHLSEVNVALKEWLRPVQVWGLA